MDRMNGDSVGVFRCFFSFFRLTLVEVGDVGKVVPHDEVIRRLDDVVDTVALSNQIHLEKKK